MLKVLPGLGEEDDRRAPGRLRLTLGNEPARDTDQMIQFYRQMLETASVVLLELEKSEVEHRRRLQRQMHQIQTQLAYWSGVREQAERMLAEAGPLPDSGQ